ncbi:RteC domain-containing protein [Flavobacterium sp.]|uniref:RteC domain-containing protein n=1 Tax=Flavobacterium sp. TaxID=239 RepID=UPI003A8E1B67
MKKTYNSILLKTRQEELSVNLDTPNVINDAKKMAVFLRDTLYGLKNIVLKEGFSDKHEEIHFFKKIKPEIQGKLLFYNKIYRIESSVPSAIGHLYRKHLTSELKRLKYQYSSGLRNSDFYRYYRSGRTDCDERFFLRGNIDISLGLRSYIFEADPLFTTYFDYKVARILSDELLYEYLNTRVNGHQILQNSVLPKSTNDRPEWTDTKNALIELIYALHATSSIDHGKTGIRKIAVVFQSLFDIQLGDIHHAFHRMKDRSGNRSLYLDKLKLSLEDYMNRGL